MYLKVLLEALLYTCIFFFVEFCRVCVTTSVVVCLCVILCVCPGTGSLLYL